MAEKDTKDTRAAGSGVEIHRSVDKDTSVTVPPAPPGPARPLKLRNLLDGPDFDTARPQPGRPTVQTSGGELDLETVWNNKVGGVGVVHMHCDPPDSAL